MCSLARASASISVTPCSCRARKARRSLPEFAERGSLDLGAARLTRRGKAAHLEMVNPRFLNAEDDTTLAQTELAVDVATLDRTTEIAVMRGVAVDNEKYRGKRIFGAGINLTHLYLGKIPFLWFLIRDLGYVHKLLRGVASPESVPDDVNGRGTSKSFGSPRSTRSPLAAIARPCCAWTTFWPRRTRS